MTNHVEVVRATVKPPQGQGELALEAPDSAGVSETMSDAAPHNWSGWPGAWCLDCGQEDTMELAIADGLYDPYAETWAEGVNPADYLHKPCPHPGEGLANPYTKQEGEE